MCLYSSASVKPLQLVTISVRLKLEPNIWLLIKSVVEKKVDLILAGLLDRE